MDQSFLIRIGYFLGALPSGALHTIRPTMHPGQMLDYEGLRRAAEEAVAADGRTQVELTAVFDVAQATMSRALNKAGGKYAALQRRIIEELAGYAVSEEPMFEVTRLPSEASSPDA